MALPSTLEGRSRRGGDVPSSEGASAEGETCAVSGAASLSVAMVAAFQAVERIFGGGLKAAWGCMLAFQLGRLAAFGLRLRGARGSEVVTKS